MTIDALYQWINFAQQATKWRLISPDKFNLCLNALYLEPMKKDWLTEEYLVGQPTARQSYQVSKLSPDDLQEVYCACDYNKIKYRLFT